MAKLKKPKTPDALKPDALKAVRKLRDDLAGMDRLASTGDEFLGGSLGHDVLRSRLGYRALHAEAISLARVYHLLPPPPKDADPWRTLAALLAWCADALGALGAGTLLPPEGERSLPMTKRDLMACLDLSPRKFATWAKVHGIRQEGNRQLWTVRVDDLDPVTRRRIEEGGPPPTKPTTKPTPIPPAKS